MKTRTGILLLSVLFFSQLYPQWSPDALMTKPALSSRDSSRLTIGADITGFFKNNEYFSPIAKGETFPGIKIQPRVAYQVDSRLRAEVGMTGLYYSGDQQKEGTYVFNGIFARLQYDIKPNFHFIFGNYYGGVNHRLIEPLYDWEREFTMKPESGLQLIYEDKKYFADVWLNWQRMIQKGDSVPEILTFGLSASALLTRPGSRLRLSVPLQLVIHHQGGQIDVSEEEMIVAGNLVTGLCAEYDVGSRFVKSAGMSLYVVGYYDKLPDNSVRPYTSGWGVYPVVTVDASPFRFMAGYWQARKFYSFEGGPLFASFNPDYPDKTLPTRSLLNLKASYSQQLHPMFALGGQVEAYSDLRSGKTDYSFGVYVRLNGPFFSR